MLLADRAPGRPSPWPPPRMGRDQDSIAHACATGSFPGLREGALKSLLQILPEQELPDLTIWGGGWGAYTCLLAITPSGSHSQPPMKPLYTSAPSKPLLLF